LHPQGAIAGFARLAGTSERLGRRRVVSKRRCAGGRGIRFGISVGPKTAVGAEAPIVSCIGRAYLGKADIRARAGSAADDRSDACVHDDGRDSSVPHEGGAYRHSFALEKRAREWKVQRAAMDRGLCARAPKLPLFGRAFTTQPPMRALF